VIEIITQEEVISLEERKKADIAALREILNKYAAMCHAGDLEGWLSLWTDDGIQMYPGAPSRVGKEQIRAGMKPAFDQFILKIAITSEMEAKVSGNLGFARGTYTLSMVPKAGGEETKFDGKYLTILEKQRDGSWKIARDCFNSNVPET
jgi:uncharacterized protein (TIGR02246 family)